MTLHKALKSQTTKYLVNRVTEKFILLEANKKLEDETKLTHFPRLIGMIFKCYVYILYTYVYKYMGNTFRLQCDLNKEKGKIINIYNHEDK